MTRSSPHRHPRDRQVRRVLLVEGTVNLLVLLAKALVGVSTGSMAVLGDALHSLTDVANNVVALIVVRFAGAPPDREHPYGHRKFETLAIFGLASLLTVSACEIALRAVQHSDRTVARHGWSLGVMLLVLGCNVGLALWEGAWARRLDSDLLRADSRHTLSDVLITLAIISGWQAASLGVLWLDTGFALGVAGLVLWLAYGLFKRAVPVLVDRIATDPERIVALVQTVPGVRRVRRVRSRWVGSQPTADLIVTVDASLSTTEAHAIADAIETRLRQRLGMEDVTVHIEPEARPADT